MDDEHTLRATSDRMLAMVDDLRALEGAKRDVPIGTPEFVALASDVEQLSRLIFRWASMQLQGAQASTAAVHRGELRREPLENFEPRPLERILAAWREAQMRFELAVPGSPEAAEALDEVERLREEFRAVQDAKREHDAASS